MGTKQEFDVSKVWFDHTFKDRSFDSFKAYCKRNNYVGDIEAKFKEIGGKMPPKSTKKATE